MRRIAIVTLTLACLAGLVAPSAAQTDRVLGVSPALGRVSTLPGSPAEETVSVVNLSTTDLTVEVSVGALSVDRDGRVSAPPRSDLRSAARWVRVDPTTFSLPRGHSTTVRVTLATPDDAAPGGHYAAVRFDANGPGLNATAVHGVLVVVGGTGPARRARVTSVALPAVSFGSSIPATLTIENTGDIHVEARGRLIVEDAFGRETATVLVPRTIVLPGRRRQLTVDVPAPLVPYRARVRTEVGFGRGIPVSNVSASAYALPWWGIVAWVIVLLILVRVVVAIARRRRRKQAVRAPVFAPAPDVAVRAGAASPESMWPGEAPLQKPRPAQKPVPAPKPTPAPEPLRAIEHEPERETAVREATPRPIVPVPVPQPPAPAPAPPPEEPEQPREPERVPEPVVVARPAPEPEPIASPPRPTPEPVAPPAPRPAAVAAPPPERAKPQPVAAPIPDEPPARLLVLTRDRVVEKPSAPLRPAAAMRRAQVALGLVSAGDGRSDARVDVGLEILNTVASDASVKGLVRAAYDDARVREDRAHLPQLALALAMVDPEAGPEALLRAFATARGAVLEQLRAALTRVAPDALRRFPDLLSALPKTRRTSIKLD